MTIERGDVVQLHGKRGLWTAIEPVSSPNDGRWWRFLQEREPINPAAFVCGGFNATLVFRPVFPLGTELRYRGERVEVVSDLGERVRCVSEEKRHAVGEYTITHGVGECEIARGELVSENIITLARIAGMETEEND